MEKLGPERSARPDAALHVPEAVSFEKGELPAASFHNSVTANFPKWGHTAKR